MLGHPEIIAILLIALLLFGPKKLPEVGRTLGSAMRELRNAAKEFSSTVEQVSLQDDDENDEYTERG